MFHYLVLISKTINMMHSFQAEFFIFINMTHYTLKILHQQTPMQMYCADFNLKITIFASLDTSVQQQLSAAIPGNNFSMLASMPQLCVPTRHKMINHLARKGKLFSNNQSAACYNIILHYATWKLYSREKWKSILYVYVSLSAYT